MTNNQHGQVPEALRLAALFDADEWPGHVTLVSYARECVAELRRQHARITELEAQLEAICAGGVSGPLMTPLPGAQPALSAGWVSLPGALPKPGTPVLLDIGNKYPIRAQWVPKDSLEATGDGDFGEYNEASDMYYWPEGWYEWNQYEETHWRVDETPRAWQPLPASPTIEGFTAQDPSQPGGFDAGDMASAAAQGYRDGWTAAQADSVLDAVRLTSEQEYAIRQGHEIAASDGYFDARPQIESKDRRKVFQAGFERGWDAARKQGANHD